MSSFPVVAIITAALFIFFFLIMSIGLILRGKKMSDGCGSGSHSESDKVESCGFCSEKKKLNLCSSENKEKLKEISKLNTFGRFEKKDLP